MSNKNSTKNPKNTKNNILIIASVIFVTVAAIVFVISLSLFNGGGNNGNSSENTSSLPPDWLDEYSYSTEESSYTAPESSSKPEESSANSSSSTSFADSTSLGVEIDITQAEKIVENARLLMGTPFLDGGSDTDGFDSSGFVYYVMRESGYISCPRDIVEQSKMGVMRGFDEIKKGDVLFFSNEIGGEANFAGFYSGNGKMIGSLITLAFEGVVEVDIDNDYYREHFVSGVGIS
ncbi:MAG: C40 family peptidase [Oscillospiraceae bacterium]|nr:C40 family peptidase [Oscillospiraceae bacterium]